MISYILTLNSIIWIFIILISCFLVKLIWKNRTLYYYSSKIPGPFPWPLIGNILIFSEGFEAYWETMLKLIMKYPPIFKLWLTSYILLIFNSVPEDVDVILNTFLEKSVVYDYAKDAFGNGLITAPVSEWKKHRKMINPSFNTKILTSLIEIFSKNSKKLTKKLRTYSEQDDLMPVIWNTTLSVACETLTDTDSSQITGLDEHISGIIRVEHLIAMRLSNFMCASKTIWKYLKLYEEMQMLSSQLTDFVKKVIETRKLNKFTTIDEIRYQLFLNNLLNLKENNLITDKEIIEEVQTVFAAASETTAITLSSALLVLSIRKDIQEKAHEELYSIFGNSESDATLEDVNRMEYLERVIKEVLRLLPSVPIIARRADKTVKINSVVYPEGSNIVIPIGWLHRDPKYWRDPLNFDPDRFLPEESKKRHPCSFIPFSFGSRSCIGFKFAMLSMKVILSNILRDYELSSTKYKSILDIKQCFLVVTKPSDGCHVVLTRRRNQI